MPTSFSALLEWPIVGGANVDAVPDSLISARPHPFGPQIPVEVAVLLPTTGGNRAVMDALEQGPQRSKQAAALCLVDPYLHLSSAIDRLMRLGVGWVCNFPSVAQHDPAFESYLDDVDLGLSQEMTRLTAFQDAGFRTLAVICNEKDAPLIAANTPDAVVHMPSVASFLGGAPSSAILRAKEVGMRQSLIDANWDGPFLGYQIAGTHPIKGSPVLTRPVMG